MNGWQAAAITTLCVVTGTVHDKQHHPLAKSKVVLTSADHKQFTATTDANGNYRLSVPAGSYRVKTEEGTVTIVAVPPQQPAFFDEPRQYKPAGVTDYTYQGGHGSGAVFRSSEAMAQELQSRTQGEGREAELYAKGTGLLSHRQVKDAEDAFGQGVREFPKSVRLLLGMGSACYSEGAFDDAAEWFYKATDVNAEDVEPYLFLGRVQARQITDADGYKLRMKRFAQLHPENAWASYYYAKTLPDGPAGAELDKVLRIDPKFAAARVELGAIAARGGKYDEAIQDYRAAIADAPDLEEAHYRLAEAYRLTGQAEKAKAEMEVFGRLRGQRE